jgi:hypothetical protein
MKVGIPGDVTHLSMTRGLPWNCQPSESEGAGCWRTECRHEKNEALDCSLLHASGIATAVVHITEFTFRPPVKSVIVTQRASASPCIESAFPIVE